MKRTYMIQIEAPDEMEMLEQFSRIAKAIIVDGAVAGNLINKETMKPTGYFSHVTHKNEQGIRVEAMMAMTVMMGPALDALKDADLKLADNEQPPEPKEEQKYNAADELAALKILTDALTKAKGDQE